MNSLRLLPALLCVLAASAAGAFASDPLDTWTPLTVSTGTRTPNDLIFVNDEFWAVASSGYVEHSVDGANWQVLKSPAKDSLRDIVFGNGRYVVVGNNGLIMSSPNGLDWTLHDENPAGSAADLYDVNFAEGRFLAIGRRRVRVSTNGTDWTPGTIYGTDFEAKAVAWGNGTYVAAGSSGTVKDENGYTYLSNVQTSPDGVTWTPRITGLFFDNLTAIAFFNGRFIAGASHLFTSLDGAAWDLVPGYSDLGILGMKVINGRLFAYGYDGKLLSTPNGTDWTVHNSGTTADIRALDYDGERVLMYCYALLGGGTGPAVSEPWAQAGGGTEPGDPNDPGYPGDPGVPAGSAKIANISTRAWVGTDATQLITGFVIQGSASKELLIRAVGPTLGGYGVGGTLVDPEVTLFDGAGTVIASNNDWGMFADQPGLAARTTQASAFALNAGSKDAAMVVTVPPGSYTLHTGSSNGGTGVALAEVYDCALSQSCRLVNISSRGFIGTGDSVAIPGFVVAGDQPRKLLVRGVGPTLSNYGVPAVLADPKVTLYDGAQNIVAENNDWHLAGDQAELQAATNQVGAFALTANSADAALVVTVPPGSYTAIVSGLAGATGVALVEIYEVE